MLKLEIDQVRMKLASRDTVTLKILKQSGEWSVIDEEVVPVQQVMQKYNWTQTALHHHMLNESPKILFLHWSVTGDVNELIKQAKEIIMQTSTYQNLTGNTRTPTSGGPQHKRLNNIFKSIRCL